MLTYKEWMAAVKAHGVVEVEVKRKTIHIFDPKTGKEICEITATR